MQFIIKELTKIEEMVAQIDTIHYLYPNLGLEKYKSYLSEMIPNNYTQIAVFENDICLGIVGCWSSIKLWTGKYLEMDNFVVHPDYRSKGIGKLLTGYIEQKALDSGCSCVVLDAFVSNYAAHRFYYNQGYNPKGFHFVKFLDEKKLG